MVQESQDTIYLVLPSASAVGEGGELSDKDLEDVAGGVGGANTDMYRCHASIRCD